MTRSFVVLISLLALVGCGPGQGQLLMNVSLHARVEVELPPPPPPRPAVDLQSETVVEFFGVPLDDAQDVVFVLDVSGSMSSTATGRIASLPADKKAPAQSSASENVTSSQNVNSQNVASHNATSQNATSQSSAASGNPPPGSVPPPPPTSTKIEVARGELIATLERLAAQTRLNVIFFSDQLLAFSPAMTSLQESERAEWIDFVSQAQAAGGTALVPALRAAFMLNPRRVVLLSDGQGNVGGNDTDALRDSREAMRGGIRIDTIGIGGGHNRQLLTLLAQESGGLYQAF